MSYRRESVEPGTWEQIKKQERRNFLISIIICLSILVLVPIWLYLVDKIDTATQEPLREPESYVLVYVQTGGHRCGDLWGYISEEDYQKFLDGELKGNLRIEHPYEDGKCKAVSASIIESIETGDVSGVDW